MRKFHLTRRCFGDCTQRFRNFQFDFQSRILFPDVYEANENNSEEEALEDGVEELKQEIISPKKLFPEMKMKILNESNSEAEKELIIPKNSRVVLRCSERKKNFDSNDSETYELNPDSAALVMNENIPDKNDAVITTISGEISLKIDPKKLVLKANF